MARDFPVFRKGFSCYWQGIFGLFRKGFWNFRKGFYSFLHPQRVQFPMLHKFTLIFCSPQDVLLVKQGKNPNTKLEAL